jgi:hypothetical protein
MGMCEGFPNSNGDRRRGSIVLALIKVRVNGGGVIDGDFRLSSRYFRASCVKCSVAREFLDE